VKYYTYELIDPRNNKVFYVGKGQKKRMYSHLFEVERAIEQNKIINNKHLFYKIKSILDEGLKPNYKKVLYTDYEQAAFDKEIELIKKYGRENLCNLTDGGDGVSGCHLARPNFTGHHHTEKSKKKIGKSVKNSEEYKIGMTNRDFTGKNNPMYGKCRKGEKGLGNGKKAWKTRIKNGNTVMSERTKKLHSINASKLVECPHCKKHMNKLNANRWHFENCKDIEK